MKRIVYLLAVVMVMAGCGNRKPLLPNVSGKAGEIIVVMDKEYWEGNPGVEVRSLLARDCEFLAQQEPLYSLVNVTTGGFADLFKVHRNIVRVNINPDSENRGISCLKDLWAAPQCVINIEARSADEAVSIIKEKSSTILNTVEQAERDRVIRNCLLYEEKAIAPYVKERFGGSCHFPMGYKIKKATDSFIWIADEKQYTIQAILIYKYPAVKGAEELTLGNIISKRNEIMKDNIPGMFENTWMTTSTAMNPSVEYLKYRGRSLAQTRGFWEVENDFMGGPFVSHSFYSPDGKDIIVAEAFVYAPKFDKRQYLRQVESILYSWDWAEEK